VRRQFRLALLLAACAPAALAQFQLSYVSAAGEQQAPPVLDFGEVNAAKR